MPAYTVVMESVGRVGIERHHTHTVEADSADDAIRAAWDEAERAIGWREAIVTGPVSVNGEEVDPEVNWDAVREGA
jgi:hypothetical protein